MAELPKIWDHGGSQITGGLYQSKSYKITVKGFSRVVSHPLESWGLCVRKGQMMGGTPDFGSFCCFRIVSAEICYNT